MALLELFLMFVLQFEGISGESHYFYNRPGNDVILPCDTENDECSIIDWTYNKDRFNTTELVDEGRVVTSSDKLSRLSNCSLGIKNITAEDAGLYTCLFERSSDPLSRVYLNILTLSASPSHTDSKMDGDVTLECSLFRYHNVPPCEQNSIRWVDETGTVLLNSTFSNDDPMKCVSVLTVNPQSGHNKRYTCQFVEENSVKVEAHYTPVLTDRKTSKDSNTTFIIIGAVMVVLLLVVSAAVFIKYRRRPKVTEDAEKPSQSNPQNEELSEEASSERSEDEPENNITYATIHHADPKASPKKKVRAEEAVTYSAVKTEAGSDPSSFYSSVS